MASPEVDLDAKGFDVLEAIYELGGEATTSEVKEYTGIEKNAIVLYRFDKLEEQGLAVTEAGDPTGNRMPAKQVKLTEEAGEKIARGLFSEEEPSIVERMDRLERQFSNVVESLNDLQDEFRRWRFDPETDEEVDVREIVEKVEAFENLTEGVEDSELEDALAVEGRVSDLEEQFSVKAKYLNRARSVPRGGSGKVDVDGMDIVSALDALEAETAQLARALEAAGIEPAQNEEFFAVSGGIYDSPEHGESEDVKD